MHKTLLVSLRAGLALVCCGAFLAALPAYAAERSALAQGQQLFEQGLYLAAIEQWLAALEPIPASDSRRFDLLLRLSAAYQAAGDYPTASQILDQALPQASTPTERVLAYSQSGDVLLGMQRNTAAQERLRQALDIARANGLIQPQAHALNNLGNVLNAERRYPEALQAYGEAAELAGQAGDPTARLQALSNRVRTQLEQAKPEAALADLRLLAEAAQNLPAGREQSFRLLNVGELGLQMQRRFPPQAAALKLAADALAQARRFAETADDQRLSAYVAGYLGEVHEHAGKRESAASLTRQAIFLSQDMPDLLYRWQWQQARLLRAAGDSDGAIAGYETALNSLQRIRGELSTGRRSPTAYFRDAARPVYYELADLLLTSARATPQREANQRLLERARSVVELYKSAEIQNYFQEACVAGGEHKLKRVEDIDPHTAVFYPIILPERTELLLGMSDGLHQFSIPVKQEEMESTVQEFQKNLQTRTSWRFIRQAQQLYDWLIVPIRPTLEAHQITTLITMPDGPLRMIPMAALYDGEKYLVDQYAIATTPRLELTDPRPLPRESPKVLVSGLSESVQDFPALPSVVKEVDDVHNQFKNSAVLLDKTFLLSQLESSLQDTSFTIVHIASHGQFSSDPSQTFLLTYDDKLTMSRLSQLLQANQFRKQPVELLTLSACQTAVGDERAALGLAGVALRVGTRSAMASLWFISDQATAELVAEFYRQLENPELSKAQALRNAQLALAANPQFRHPAFWSPFLLIGNWL